MSEFTFRMFTKVLYGPGMIAKAGEACKELGATRVFLFTGSHVVQTPAFAAVEASLSRAGLAVEVFAGVEADPSIETVDSAAGRMKEFRADLAVAIGGGSPMDAAKSSCLLQTNGGSIGDYLRKRRAIVHDALPLVCIPTTAGTGSEVTAAAVTTDRVAREKIGLNHDSIMPKLAIIDPEIHASMPPALTAATGLDALCHAIEAYVSRQAEPFSDAFCLQAIRLIGQNLGKAFADGQDLAARGNMALASAIAGVAFANAGLGVVHAVAHCLGAMYHIPHGVANALILPYAMEFNLPANLPKFKEIAIALGESVAGLSLREAAARSVQAVKQLKEDVGLPATLREAGVEEKDFPAIVANSLTFRLLPANPRTVAAKDIEYILKKAMG